MKHKLFIILLLIFADKLYAQNHENTNKQQLVGIDLFQLPATTLSFKYQFATNPKLSINSNIGFTVNYANSADLIGYWTSLNFTDDANALYNKEIENGAFVNLGVQYNFRNNYEKNHFYIGLYQTNSYVYEKGLQGHITVNDIIYEKVEHKKYLFSVASNFGYQFRTKKRLQLDFGIQFSKRFNDNGQLYGHENYIPGLGFNAYNEGNSIYHLIYFNIHYLLKKEQK